jgi:hypothetical protein
MPERIVSLVPAPSGWRAHYGSDEEWDLETARVVAWALVEVDGDAQELVGLVVDGTDPTQIVTASAGATPLAPTFDRYAYKDD